MISLEAVVKSYGGRVAVDFLTLHIPATHFFSVLGPNGAGKVTLLRMTMGLVRPDEGRIRLFENLAPGASGTMRRISYMLLM